MLNAMVKGVVIKTEYFPPISTFWGMNNSKQILLETCENFQKKSTRNRTRILGVNGVELLSVPLKKGKARNKPIEDVKISYDDSWTSKHLHAIRSAYGNAPYFEFYYDGIKEILQGKPEHLLSLNNSLLDYVLDSLGMDSTITPTTQYKKEYPAEFLDLRNASFENVEISDYEAKPYEQVFEEKHMFVKGLSILDLLMCKGPESILYI